MPTTPAPAPRALCTPSVVRTIWVGRSCGFALVVAALDGSASLCSCSIMCAFICSAKLCRSDGVLLHRSALQCPTQLATSVAVPTKVTDPIIMHALCCDLTQQQLCTAFNPVSTKGDKMMDNALLLTATRSAPACLHLKQWLFGCHCHWQRQWGYMFALSPSERLLRGCCTDRPTCTIHLCPAHCAVG